MGGNERDRATAVAPAAGAAGREGLAGAVLATLAYADVFDHPLTLDELHRYLVGLAVRRDELERAVRLDDTLRGGVGEQDGLFFLAGRGGTVATRRRRAEVAARLWPAARAACRAIAGRPFVRLVAVTGALAVDSVESGADIDLLVVARAGRVWTCRAFVVAFARQASRRGPRLCPNYVLSEGALAFTERTVYAARELAQLVPVAGPSVYARLRAANPWAAELLPNAAGPPRAEGELDVGPRGAFRWVERLHAGRLGDVVERVAARAQAGRLTRKIARAELGGAEVTFSADTYKGHFDGHGGRILAAWAARLARLGVQAP